MSSFYKCINNVISETEINKDPQYNLNKVLNLVNYIFQIIYNINKEFASIVKKK